MPEQLVTIFKDGSTEPAKVAVGPGEGVTFSSAFDVVICFKTEVFGINKLVIPHDSPQTVYANNDAEKTVVDMLIMTGNLNAKCPDEATDDPKPDVGGD